MREYIEPTNFGNNCLEEIGYNIYHPFEAIDKSILNRYPLPQMPIIIEKKYYSGNWMDAEYYELNIGSAKY